MITSKERESLFINDLKALLEKHGASLSTGTGTEDNPSLLFVSMATIWNNDNNNKEKEYCFFQVKTDEL